VAWSRANQRRITLSTKLTRKKFLKAAGAGAAWVTLQNLPGCERAERAPKATPAPTTSPASPQHELAHDSPLAPRRGTWAFRSRPDLSPPAVEVKTQAHDTAPGHVFVAPEWGGSSQGGPMIVDDRGQVVWFRPLQDEGTFARDFKVQHYRDEPVLTWWEGYFGGPSNEYVILDDSYQEVTRVRAGNGYRADHHEFLITPQDTALIMIYDAVRQDLSLMGGPRDGVVWQGIVQEVDIETGQVLFEWHSLEHVGLDETYAKPSNDALPGIDYLHINSIDVDHDGNLLVCARETFAVYKIDRKSGEVMWRLGGKKSDFYMGPGTRFAYQHDARRQPDGTITIFDNGTTVFSNGVPRAIEESRCIVLELDEEEMSAKLVREYTHPNKLYADAGGNMQVLPNGNMFIGWGRALVLSELSSDGELLFDASLPPESNSYRAFRFPWSGHPSDQPAVAAERTSEDKVKVYASWNGATEVTTWVVLGGLSPDRMRSLGSVPRDGFETAIAVHATEPYVGVRAKGHSGRVLGTSKTLKLRR
jgi:hypothetical protein